MQTEILTKNLSAELRAYAIWFNMYPGDHRSKWDDTLIADPRVTRLWDEQKIVGRWLVDHEVVDYSGEILWDAYLLFGPEAMWDATPGPLISWGQPVYRTEHQLEASLLPILCEFSKKARRDGHSLEIKVLYTEGCPGTPTTIELIEEVAKSTGTPIRMKRILVKSPDQALAYRFLGSPTVQVNGLDVDPSARENMAYGFT